jgi:amino acid permease
LFSWLKVLCLVPFFILFLIFFLHWWTIMGTHGTIWHHRYCTHGAYTFRNKFWRFVTQNLTINVIPEEIYAISHHEVMTQAVSSSDAPRLPLMVINTF